MRRFVVRTLEVTALIFVMTVIAAVMDTDPSRLIAILALCVALDRR